MNNETINNLKKKINENKLSHAFLVETNNIDNALSDIYKVFIECNKFIVKDIKNNPNILIIEPENNLINVEKISNIPNFVYTTSFDNNYKIYFIKNSEKMNITSSNKLLKVLEEPSPNVIGFLITENINTNIETIISRCEKIKLTYTSFQKEEYTEIINELLNYINQDFKYENLLDIKSKLLKYEKFEINEILESTKIRINQSLGHLKNTLYLAQIYKILDNIIDLLQMNCNLEITIDRMLIEMRNNNVSM